MIFLLTTERTWPAMNMNGSRDQRARRAMSNFEANRECAHRAGRATSHPPAYLRQTLVQSCQLRLFVAQGLGDIKHGLVQKPMDILVVRNSMRLIDIRHHLVVDFVR